MIASHDQVRAKPMAPSPLPLTHQEDRFATEYLLDLNGTRAMLRAAPGIKKESAAVQASRLLRRANVTQRIDQLIEERAQRLRVTTDEVLSRLWAIGTADVRELVSVCIDPCPRCWHCGPKHMSPRSETDRGEASLGPDANCETCGGGGRPRVTFADTRTMTDGARMLIAGVRRTPSGPEYEMHSQLEAMRLVGRHLGMWSGNAAATPEGPAQETQSAKDAIDSDRHFPPTSDEPLANPLPRQPVSDELAESRTQPTPWRALKKASNGRKA